jgi:peptidoglycan-associated lipoprotein
MKKADAVFETGEYFKAAEMYEKLYDKATSKDEKAQISFKLGECSRKINEPKGAKKWYKKAISNKSTNPEAILYYADALKTLEEYDDAKIQYQAYKDLVPDDERGTNGLESVKLILDWKADPTRHVVGEVKDLNSKFSDYGVSYGNGESEVYFTSTRQSSNGTDVNKVNGENFADIFFAQLDRKGKWSIPVPVEGAVNTNFDDGTPCLINNGSIMYFTRCKQDKNATGCQIYRSRNSGDKWGDAELVKLFSDSTATVGDPWVSPDELTIYFVSDYSGKDGKAGYGGKDIWKAERSSVSSKWNAPMNMGGKINTKGDEMFPFRRPNGELYFASNGHPGMGGLDMFVAKPNGTDWTIENLKYPLNSPYDDFGIVFFENKNEGYFSSSRDKNDKIYSFEVPDLIFTLKGFAQDSKTEAKLADAEVSLDGDDGSHLETKSGTDGSFRFNLKPKVDYAVIGAKKQYLKAKVNVSTKGEKESKNFEVVLDMAPIISSIELPNIEYDFAQATLRDESKVSLDGLVQTLEINSNITIELQANTDFVGTDESNQDLSQKRAQTVVDYLILKGIKADRLTAVGYGKKNPKKVDDKLAKKFDFLKEGDILTEEFIKALPKEQQQTCNQLNRRTEFKVLRDDYGMNNKAFGEE